MQECWENYLVGNLLLQRLPDGTKKGSLSCQASCITKNAYRT